jgi:hypothetical protein
MLRTDSVTCQRLHLPPQRGEVHGVVNCQARDAALPGLRHRRLAAGKDSEGRVPAAGINSNHRWRHVVHDGLGRAVHLAGEHAAAVARHAEEPVAVALVALGLGHHVGDGVSGRGAETGRGQRTPADQLHFRERELLLLCHGSRGAGRGSGTLSASGRPAVTR